MHRHQPRQPRGEEHDGHDEQHAGIERPKLGVQADHGLQHCEDDCPDNRTDEKPDPAKERHQQNGA